MIVRIVLGEEYDVTLRAEVSAALEEMSARQIDSSWGVGGSQEISSWTFGLDGAKVVIETETYMGLSISGEELTVLEVTRRLESRGWAPPVS